MTTYYKYRIRCTTDNIDEYRILKSTEPEPTTCPTNTNHTIDPTQTTIVDTIEDSVVTIKEESTPTGGNFRATTLKINALKNQISSNSTIFPHPISALSVEFTTKAEHEGDCIDLVVGENTIIGAITADVDPASAWVSQNYTAGQVVTYNSKTYTCILNTISNEVPTNITYWQHGLEISVSQTVIDNTQIGYHINLYDGTNTDHVNIVVRINTVSNKIYVETNLTNSFAAATPTYVRQSVYTIKDYELGPGWQNVLGESKIGGSHIPKNTEITVYYDNKSVDTDKIFIGRVEYLY